MTAWDLNRAAFRDHLKTDKLEDFLRWSTIEKTMFVGDVGFIHKEMDELLGNGILSNFDIWRNLNRVLHETETGNPKKLWGWTSGNLIHQLYHLKQWMDRGGKTVDTLQSIIEVGAGYGAMCLICRRLRFTGQYHIIDFPELERIQRYYLQNTVSLDRVTFEPEHCYLPYVGCNLLIACHSISEMPIAERERLLSQVEADAYLFASSYEFEGVDNEAWFSKFADSKPGYEWAQRAHPHQENAFYQVGTRL